MHANHKSVDVSSLLQHLVDYAESIDVRVRFDKSAWHATALVISREICLPTSYSTTRAFHTLAHELGHIIAYERQLDHSDEVLAWDLGEKLLKQQFGVSEVPMYKEFIDTKFECLESYGIDTDVYYRNKRFKFIAKAIAYAACAACVTIAISGYSQLFTSDVQQPSSYEGELY